MFSIFFLRHKLITNTMKIIVLNNFKYFYSKFCLLIKWYADYRFKEYFGSCMEIFTTAMFKKIMSSTLAIFGGLAILLASKPKQLLIYILIIIASIAFVVFIFLIPNGELQQSLRTRKYFLLRVSCIAVGIITSVLAYILYQGYLGIGNGRIEKENEVIISATTSTPTQITIEPNSPEPITFTPTNTEAPTTPTSYAMFPPPIMEAYQVGRDYFDNGKFNDAYQFLLKAALAGHSNAQLYTGRCLKEGVRVDENATSAAEWFTLAANQGNEEAQYELGRCYYGGSGGVDKNDQVAFYWFSAAASRGSGNGLLWTGYCYHHGYGVEQNYDLAKENYIAAGEKGQAYAQKRLEELQNDIQNEDK